MKREPWRAVVARSRAAWSVLRRRLGTARALRLVWQLSRALRRGEPFVDLPPVETEKQAWCRQQLGPAIALYRILKAQRGAEAALELTADLVLEATVAYLRTQIPALQRKDYEVLPESERQSMLTNLVDQFPNVEVGAFETSDRHFRFTVSRCVFVGMCRDLGHPELAPIFCAGDGAFFERHMPEIAFDRPTTRAQGQSCCDFRFAWREDLERDAGELEIAEADAHGPS